jgi:choloylglycine hydrolase
MKITRRLSILSLFLLMVFPKAGLPCTAFTLDEGDLRVFGKNYDWMVQDGLIVINKRAMSKTAIRRNDVGRPAAWISKYGSVTFNQFGREFPQGGMNEVGLVVETMALPGGKFPEPDSRPFVNRLQWRQYQLDSFSSVEEVIASDSQIRIAPANSKASFGSHFLVSDLKGDCAVIEFIDGKMVVHKRKTMPVSTLTNNTYEESVRCWQTKSPPSNDPNHSLSRFIRAADMVSRYKPDPSKSLVDYAFDVLTIAEKNSRVRTQTMWSIVYDQKNLRIYFRTAANREIRTFSLEKCDFSCTTPVKVLDINGNQRGEVTKHFSDYTLETNHSFICNGFRKTPYFRNIPNSVLDEYSRYPEGTHCTH